MEKKPFKEKILLIIPSIAFLIASAHFLRNGNLGITYIFAICSILVFISYQYLNALLSIFLVTMLPIWIKTGITIYSSRVSDGKPYFRAILIVLFVAIFTLFSSYTLFKRTNLLIKENFYALLVSIITILLLSIAYNKQENLILLERFIVDGGKVQIFLAGILGGLVFLKLFDLKSHSKWRLRFWLLFSLSFYLQFFLGLFGYKIFLMSGKLHIPVPAMVIAGPIYRGDGFFMPILFLITILFVGPAWCSHLCYFGSIDNAFANRKKFPHRKPKIFVVLRVSIFLLVIVFAIWLRMAQISLISATIVGSTFGILSVVLIILFSRKLGLMVNCTSICPLGFLSNLLGRVSPFRLKIKISCNGCMKCFKACRYGALSFQNIKDRKVGFTCSLCGDCIHSCPTSEIYYSFLKLKGENARILFNIFISIFFASFFAIAMV